MDIRIYARSPSQEFSVPVGEGGGVHWKWSNNWPSNSTRPPHPALDRKQPLETVLSLRRDNNDYGFVYNCQNDLVFYVDAEAYVAIERHLTQPVGILEGRAPWLLDALQILR